MDQGRVLSFLRRIRHVRLYTSVCRVCGSPADMPAKRMGRHLYYECVNGVYAIVFSEFVLIGPIESVPGRKSVCVHPGMSCVKHCVFSNRIIAAFRSREILEIPLDTHLHRIVVHKYKGLCRRHALDAYDKVVFYTKICPVCHSWHGVSMPTSRVPFPLRMATIASGTKARSDDVIAFDVCGRSDSIASGRFDPDRIRGDMVVLLPKCPAERLLEAEKIVSRLGQLVGPHRVYLAERACVPPGTGDGTGPRRFRAARPLQVLCGPCLDAKDQRRCRCRVCGDLLDGTSASPVNTNDIGGVDDGSFGLECSVCAKETVCEVVRDVSFILRSMNQCHEREFLRCYVCGNIQGTAKMLTGQMAKDILKIGGEDDCTGICDGCLHVCKRCGELGLEELCEICRDSVDQRFPAVCDSRVSLRHSKIMTNVA